MTKEQLNTIRDKVKAIRHIREEQLIQNKIDWSTTASKRSWLSKVLWSLPDKPWTREEALAQLEHIDSTWPGVLLGAPIDWAREYASGILDLCEAVESAENLGLPLKLSVDYVVILNSWLK
jgi:hypothetical protein